MSTLAWHFLPNNGHLRYGTKELVEVGRAYSATGPLKLCTNGMHASVSVCDALKHAPGSLLCRVELSGEMLTADDKLCSRTRTVLWKADATNVLIKYAVLCAERALKNERKNGREPDSRSWKAVHVTKQYLVGKATQTEVRNAANAAANATASAAAYAAAYAAYAADAAANATASAAAYAAAYAAYAANAAAYAATYAAYAANAAAYAAEVKWQSKLLTRLCLSLERAA